MTEQTTPHTTSAAAKNITQVTRNSDQSLHIEFTSCRAASAFEAALAASAPVAPTQPPIELRGVDEEIQNGGGFWRSCTGCHELNEGHDTGPYSAIFKCALGGGCRECGGIGAIWDTTDYDSLADQMAGYTPEAAPVAPAPQPAGFVLVPVVPTQDMLDAVVTSVDDLMLGDAAEKQYREDWAAMLAAAPKAAPGMEDTQCRCEPSDYVMPADYDGDGSVTAMARKAAPQQGEYLPPDLPIAAHRLGDIDLWPKSAMCGYGEVNWKAGFKQGAWSNTAPPAPSAQDAEDAARWELLMFYAQDYAINWSELIGRIDTDIKKNGRRVARAQQEGGEPA